MKAMIFAAGTGSRLKPLTDHTPKALIPIGGKPMLEHVILKLKSSGFDQIVINIHHLGNQIVDFLEANNNFGVRRNLDESDYLLYGRRNQEGHFSFMRERAFLVHNGQISYRTWISRNYTIPMYKRTRWLPYSSASAIPHVIYYLIRRIDCVVGVIMRPAR